MEYLRVVSDWRTLKKSVFEIKRGVKLSPTWLGNFASSSERSGPITWSPLSAEDVIQILHKVKPVQQALTLSKPAKLTSEDEASRRVASGRVDAAETRTWKTRGERDAIPFCARRLYNRAINIQGMHLTHGGLGCVPRHTQSRVQLSRNVCAA